ncbi:MAG: class I SAM-dependent methyltransferase [Phycisphaeraceae bacterium JB051]
MSDTPHCCRICGNSETRPVLHLGKTPLANALLKDSQLNQPEPRYDLNLVFCPQCALVQIDLTVPPEALFSDYPYFSSFSDTMVNHARQLAMSMIDRKKLDANSLVIEPASNDGYLLQHYKQAGVNVLGIEPATNIAKVANEKNITTRNDFFTCELASELASQGVKADVIHAHNVMAHVADLNGFVQGVATLLKSDGTFILEAPYVRDMIDHVEFDTIYHEHLCYFSLTALKTLFENHGLYIVHVEHVPIHGGTIQVHTSLQNLPDQTVSQMLDDEKACGMDTFDYYSAFADKVENLKEQLILILEKYKSQGASIAAYGASAKGSTLLNYTGVGKQYLDFVVDRSTHKQGQFTPGTHLPILPTDALLERKPDYVLLLTWNFADEILAQQKAFCDQGGRFIVPVPTPHLA